MIGRFFWSSISDYIGRKNLYFIFFIIGAGLYSLIPLVGKSQNLELFILCYCLILSMYGGGFSGIPAYLADLYGVKNVGAIHGRLLTSWSVAGILGPVLVNYIRESQINQGVPKSEAYNVTMHIMVGLLLFGAVCNFFVKPVDPK
jgi:MFS family permease